MKISHKLIIGFLFVAVLASIPLYFTMQSYDRIDEAVDRTMNDPVEVTKTLEKLRFAGVRIVSLTSEYAFVQAEKREIQGSSKFVNNEEKLLTESYTQIELLLENHEELVKAAVDETDSMKLIRSSVKSLVLTSGEIIRMKRAGIKGLKILEKKKELDEYKKAFLSEVDEALSYEFEELKGKQTNVKSTIIFSTWMTQNTTGMTFLVAIAIGFLISYGITKPLSVLKNAARNIGEGDLETVIDVNSKDEVGELAESFKTMIAELKSSRDEIVKNKDFAENIIISMADMLITVDDDGVIKRVNETTMTLTGYKETEIVGQSVRMLTGTETFLNEDEFQQMTKTRKLFEIEKDFVRKNGEKFKVSISSSILQGRSAAAVIVAKDISNRIADEKILKQYTDKLEQSNKELEDFAYVASHDLQEPLRKVQAFGDRLVSKYGESLNEEATDYIRRMRNAAGRMQSLINDLLTFSRVASKARSFQAVDIKEITKAVVSDLEVRIEQTRGKVEIGDLPTIDVDPVQMRQLLQNLIGNALKFHRPNKNPVVKVRAEIVAQTGGTFLVNEKDGKTIGDGSSFCKIIVQDNGIGFEEKYLNKIFTVFQRLHGRTDYDGSGIGLAVCRKIAERHGGIISAISNPSVGSTFFVTLPVNQRDRKTII